MVLDEPVSNNDIPTPYKEDKEMDDANSWLKLVRAVMISLQELRTGNLIKVQQADSCSIKKPFSLKRNIKDNNIHQKARLAAKRSGRYL